MQDQKYRVIKRLEAGGMAEVFLGESLSVQGFTKRVAIKRVLPDLAKNKRFIRMFLDEARLGARLNHANIVSVIDIGADDDTYFLVMEFVDGANMKTLQHLLDQQSRRIAPKEMVFIAMEACRGLSYAHELVDDEGTPLQIVHRDISPPNILLTRRGEVKVADFGLAKAASLQLEKTDPGVVKGKFAYLSPEAAMGEEVDARADVFSLGTLIWEMLANRRLFLGDSDYDTVQNVREAKVPRLAEFNTDVDEALEQILAKAMARDRDQRYASARDLGKSLAEYLFSQQLTMTSYELGSLVSSALASQREKPSRPPSMIDQLIEEELLAFTSLEDMDEPVEPSPSDGLRGAGSPLPIGAAPLDAHSFAPGPMAVEQAEREALASAGNQHSHETGSSPAPPSSDPTELAALLEDDSQVTSRDERVRAGSPPAAASLTAAEASLDSGSAQQQARQSSSEGDRMRLSQRPTLDRVPIAPGPELSAQEPRRNPLSLLILVALVLIGAGAAAWFTNLIPR